MGSDLQDSICDTKANQIFIDLPRKTQISSVIMPQFSQSIDDGGSINLLNEAFASTNYQQFQPGKLSKPKPFNPSTTAREANVSQTYIDQLKQLRKEVSEGGKH